MRLRNLLLAAGSALAFAASAGSASAANITVDDDFTQCKNANFQSIQAAIDSAVAGDAIFVCKGTYAEQLTITKKLTIKAKTTVVADRPVITPPAGGWPAGQEDDLHSIIRVDGATGVLLQRLVVQGPGYGGCNTIDSGVRIANGGGATMSDSAVRNIRDDEGGTISGCQNGLAFNVGGFVRNDENGNAVRTTGTLTSTRNEITGYQKLGIYVDNAGSKLTAKENTITGVGCTSKIASYGIQVSRGAKATIQNNTVKDNCYTGDDAYSGGLIAYSAAAGVLVGGNSGTSTGKGNVFSGNDVGLDIEGTSSLIAGQNTIDGSASQNQYATGIYNGADALKNRFYGNTATGHSYLDCDDDSTGTKTAGTASIWFQNTGNSSDPEGICTPGTAIN